MDRKERPSGAKARGVVEHLAARLKPRPFKATEKVCGKSHALSKPAYTVGSSAGEAIAKRINNWVQAGDRQWDWVMVNVIMGEAPPAVTTETLTLPAVTIWPAGTSAVILEALTTVVASAVVPQFTFAPETKFVPLTVSVKPGPPAAVELGLRLAIVGGLGSMVNVAGAVVPPGVVTVTFAEPAVTI